MEHAFSIWTNPDAVGTPFENKNRSWFCFGVTGGPGGGCWIELTLMNLNRQKRLFAQGMMPAYMVLPDQPYWERVPGAPVRYTVSWHKTQQQGGKRNPNVVVVIPKGRFFQSSSSCSPKLVNVLTDVHHRGQNGQGGLDNIQTSRGGGDERDFTRLNFSFSCSTAELTLS